MSIQDSSLLDNISGKFENYTGMFVLASSGSPSIVNSTLK
jgi:ABC-type tungstate transport system permease subunit